MNKITASLLIIIVIFGIGFFSGRMSKKVEVVRTPEINEAITNIQNYTNYIRTLEYVTNTITNDELVVMYNDLLKRSKEVAVSYDELFRSYEKLEKIVARKLYFLVGGKLEYNIEREAIDLGLTAGVEYYNVAYTLGYLFFDRQISLNVSYRF